MQNVLKTCAIVLWLIMGACLVAVTPNAIAQGGDGGDGADGSAVLGWNIPTERENGVALAVEDIGGYEIRYRPTGDVEFEQVVVPDGAATSFTLSGLGAGSYDIEIAAYDTDGLFSNYIPITYSRAAKPKAPSQFISKPKPFDVLVSCLAFPNCRVAVDGEW